MTLGVVLITQYRLFMVARHGAYIVARHRARIHLRRLPLAAQVLMLLVGLLTLVLGVGFTLVGYLLDRELTDQFGQRALAVARTVAADPVIVEAAANDDPSHVVQGRAERLRQDTGALFVVVTDRRGVRLSHPKPELIGKPVKLEGSALSGTEVVTVAKGNLGLSARGKVPIRLADHRTIVGEVSVGFDSNEVQALVLARVSEAAMFAAGALTLGVLGGVLLSRRLKRLTLGLEPRELAELVQEREAVLRGIGEGVLAVDQRGQVTVCNDEAAQLLGIRSTRGMPVSELRLPPRLQAVLAHDGPVNNVITVAGDRVLVVNQRTVRRDGRDLGRVVTLRDRTDLDTLTRELDSVRNLTRALRAQRHEFANRLHTLSGLLQTRHYGEAVEYLHALSGPTADLGPSAEGVQDPCLQGFLSAKKAEAAEKEVALRVGESSWVPAGIVAPVEVTTVVGNLLDNALDAARLGSRRPAWIEVDLVADGGTLHVSVVDSGDGVPQNLRARIFAEGVSSKVGERGLGLALAETAARSRGGQVVLADAGGPDQGALFTAQLPAVLVSQ